MKNWRQSCDATRGKAAFCFRLVSSCLSIACFLSSSEYDRLCD